MKVTMHYGWKLDYFGKPELTVWNADYVSEDNGFTKCGQFELEVDTEPPSHSEVVNAKVSELRKEQGELIAKSNMIESKIQELLCIEYKPDFVEAA